MVHSTSVPSFYKQSKGNHKATTLGIQWTVQWTILMVANEQSQNSLFGKIKNKKFGCNINYEFQNRSSVKREHQQFIQL